MPFGDTGQEEQANLLGELGVLRSYKHPHLVEFIGAAMAMERGADTVRQMPKKGHAFILQYTKYVVGKSAAVKASVE